MRIAVSCLLLIAAASAQDVTAVSDEDAKAAVKEATDAMRQAKAVEEKQEVVFSLHDVPHDLCIRQLTKYLKNKDASVRGVAALALGGQGHNKPAVGKLLMKTYQKERKELEVAISCLDAFKELKWYGYWPALEKEANGKGARSAIVIRILELLGANKDYRALPMLLEMYKVAMPKRVTWKTGTVNVDTGAAGNEDNEAAEREFNRRYGRGGSKERRKAEGKAKSFDARNFTTQIRKCAKEITGEDFETDVDLEDWWIDNYEKVARLIAKLDGTDPDKAARKALKELPARKKEVAEARKKLEEELAQQEKKDK
ncbi:MAG: hypothetical protein ACYTEG_06370 [Planctomycetota bacterium]|jgi:hypothetical protein